MRGQESTLSSTILKPSATVYSWYLPEIAELVGNFARFDYPSEVFTQNYSPGLDTLHEPLLEDYAVHSLGQVFHASDIFDFEKVLPNAYYTNGSSEGLFHLLARHKTHFPKVPLYQFEGEYQGYGEFAKTLDLEITNAPFTNDFSHLQPGVFIVSTPSAVDGNVLGADVIDAICDHHYVIIDCAYAGMARFKDEELLSLNKRVVAVVGSMSKPFGLYYHRIGFLWSRDPVPSLYGNKWFKNAFSIELGKEVFQEYSAQYFADRYRPWQAKACEHASVALGCEIVPSDVWLLGWAQPGPRGIPEALKPYQRGPAYRVCLTPYFMEYARVGF